MKQNGITCKKKEGEASFGSKIEEIL